jgi:hypothetical protein
VDTPDVKNVLRTSRSRTPFRFLARTGFAMNGILNAIIGVIAIGIAVTGGGSADQSGALAAIAATPGGKVALWAITIGLAALGLWYLLGSPFGVKRDTKRRVAMIAIELGKGIAYLLLAATAFTFVQGSGQSSSAEATTLTADLLATPGGKVGIVLIGLLFIGIGIYMVRKGLTRGFERDIRVPGGTAGTAVKGAGVFGYVARGVALFLVGALFIAALITFDPSKATGLDGALKTLAALPFGQFILVIVGLGFIAFGVYSVVRARLANLS